MIKLDAFGKACPLPVIMVKNEIEKEGFKGEDIVIQVDNYIAVQNIEKLAKAYGVELKYQNIEGGYLVEILIGKKECKLVESIDLTDMSNIISNPAYLIIHETLGGGDDELGANLMQMFIFSISQMDRLPRSIAFMNGGVKLATLNKEVILTLKELENKGVKVLVCGTCLNFYNLTDKLVVGEVSNAYEILETLQAGNAITI